MLHGFPKLLPSALLLGALLLPVSARAHGAIHDRIDAVTKRLAETPDDADLYLKRAELYRVDGSWEAALADYGRASDLAPGMAAVDLARAEMLFEAARPAPALEAVDRYLAAEPGSYDARVLRGRILALLARHGEAAEAFEKALARTGPSTLPQPDIYLELARSLASAGRPGAAIARLDEGMTRLGRLASLENLAIELERSMGRYEGALTRVDRLIAETPRPVTWLILRGQIAGQAGEAEAARSAFESALAAIDAVPRDQRTPRVLALEREAREALADTPEAQPGSKR